MGRQFISILMLSSAIAQANPQNNTVRIVADAMDCDQQQNICIATGNAFAERPDDPDKRTIRAEKFIAHFSKSSQTENKDQNGAGKNDLDKIEAHGHVVITDKDSIILCDKAIYDHPKEIVELFDNVKITNQQNQLNGSYGHADLKTKKYHVTNNGKLVEGLFVNTDKKVKS